MSAVDDPARLEVVKSTGLLDSPADPEFDRITKLAARLLRCPIALISLVDGDRQFFKSSLGLAEPWASRRETPLSHSFCQHAVRTGQPLVVQDARRDPMLEDNLAIAELGVIAYAGIPLRTEGHALGAFCVIDSKPRSWSDDDVATLVELAHAVERQVELRKSNAALAQKTALLEAVVDSMEESVMAVDAKSHVFLLNAAARRQVSAAPPDEPEARKAWFADHGFFLADGRTQLSRADSPTDRALTGETVREMELLIRSPSEPRATWVSVNSRPIRDDAGAIVGAVTVSRDTTAFRALQELLHQDMERLRHANALLEKQSALLREMSLTDELTGLFNRRGFVTLADKEIQSANRNKRKLLVLFADLNGLKDINDRLGHEMGDNAIVDTANLLRKTFRQSDVLARLGGDEFVVLVTGSSPDDPAVVSARLEVALRAHNASPACRVPLSLSLGSAIYDPSDPRTIDAVISEADAAMYVNKRGRSSERKAQAPQPRMKVCPACKRVEQDGRSVCPSCATSLDGVLDATVIDEQYVVLEELGRGSMGAVHLAYDVALERRVALKLIVPRDGKPLPLETVRRFRREAAALAAINSPQVVQVHAFGPHGDSYFFAMEHIDGVSLAEIAREHAEHGALLPVARVVSVVRQIADGLDRVHATGLIHRDVKPANIVIENRSGRPVLIDFGIVYRAARDSEPGAAIGAGTPQYMAPELLIDGPSVQSDVYALACSAYELLTGRPPFLAPDVRTLLVMHRLDRVPLPSRVRPGLEPFDAVLVRALAKDPGDRHGSCGELATALEEALVIWETPEPTLSRPAPPMVSATVATQDPSPMPSDGPYLEILVVDDDEICRRMMVRCVQVAFYQVPVRVRVAESGLAALASAQEHMPHLIVLDYAMPGLDGIDTLTRIRGLPGGGGARVVVSSANSGDAERWRFGVLGVKDFADKPISFTGFVQLITDIADQAGWTHSLRTAQGA